MAATGGQADDLAIYGTVSTAGLEPNVMIIFDTSGSMEIDDVPKDPYDKIKTYSGGYSTNAVYERTWNNSAGKYEWPLFVSDVNQILCADVRSSLLSFGYDEGKVRLSNLKCGGSDAPRYLRLGNYLNYIPAWSEDDDDDDFRRRIDVAKEVLTTLIDQTTGVRFGLMVFNNNQGGRVVAPCGTSKKDLKAQIAAAKASGWTPLAETLAEAGLYFAGKSSWFNPGVNYTSPMQERCQKNFIIVMTDGEPTKDRDSRLYNGAYINGDTIGDYDGDHGGGLEFDSYPSEGSDYLDDVAKYLYVNDCNPSLGTGTAFEKQNIVTFTIGFKLNHRLLYDTAVNGGGNYYTAGNYSDLTEAFTHIMSAISEKNASFVAPAVPASDLNNAFAGSRTYLGFFKPQQSGSWIGNIKRYGVDPDGTLRDALGNPAVDAAGMIRDEARSFWTTTGADGPAVEKGGAAEALALFLAAGGSRRVYTWTGTAPLLTDAANAFATANTAITNAALGVASDAERQALFTTVRSGRFGDVIHSEPAVVAYADADGNPSTSDPKTVIFVGANDGLLHAIDDASGDELWSFVPPEHLGRLKRLTDADHDYFVDGSPVVFNRGGQKILVVGSRRGGEHYSALDVTIVNAPRFLYRIGPNLFDPNPSNVPDTDAYERLGQSWSRPERAVIATGSSIATVGCGVQVNPVKADVLVLAGGYDTNQDLPSPSASDSVGRAVFAVDLATGQPVSGLRFSPTTHPALGMTHSVVDVSVFDHDNDGIASRVYFGDLGGNLFAFKDDENQSFTVCGQTVVKSVVDGSWTGRKLFNASADGVRRKILYAPDAAPGLMAGGIGEHLFFGTGDRENPLETAVVNRFYALKNDWSAASTLTESDLVDVTDDLIQLGTAAEKTQVQSNLDAKKGWYIRLENPGEKVVATPRVYGGVVYFTTYTPSAGAGPSPSDPCAGSVARGVARVYALNWKNGGSAHDFAAAAETDRSGKTVSLGKTDRSTIIGTAIPSAPVIAILGGITRLFAGIEGGVATLPTAPTPDLHRFFWNRIH
jgi:type IV pilus assembly protein PilY1